MNRKKQHILVVTALIIFAVTTFAFWFVHNPVKDFTASVPGSDNRPKIDPNQIDSVSIGESFKFYKEFNSKLKGKWVRFRGANSDNIVQSSISLIDDFKDIDSRVLWQVNLGEGHAAPVIYNGKAYILDHIEAKKQDALRCFSLETGEELWRRWYKVHIKRNHGMSRTTPAITDKYLLTVGPRGHVMCVKPNTGEMLWGLDLVEQYGTEIPFWYTGQCPIIDNDVAILAPGGKAILIGVDCASGKVLWETPNPDSLQMSHSSVMPMKIGNKNTYVYAAIGSMVGISAEGSDIGKVLWKNKAFAPNVIAPSPLVLPNNRIFMTAGYGAGSIVLEINPSNYSVSVIDLYKPKDGLASEQQTPIYWNNHLFGILPKDAGGLRNQFVCVKPDDTKNILWSSTKEHRYGLGPYVWADGKFFILNDDGTLSIVKANTKGFFLLDKTRIIEGHDAWGPLAIADGYLLMRDSKHLVCIDIRK